MSEGLNQVTLFGYLGADPELKSSEKGAVLKMRVATTRVWVDPEKKKHEATDWNTAVVFGRRAESLSGILVKGARVLIQGRLHSYSYEKDGQKRYGTDVIAEDVHIVQTPGGAEKRSTNGLAARPSAPLSAELPF